MTKGEIIEGLSHAITNPMIGIELFMEAAERFSKENEVELARRRRDGISGDLFEEIRMEAIKLAASRGERPDLTIMKIAWTAQDDVPTTRYWRMLRADLDKL